MTLLFYIVPNREQWFPMFAQVPGIRIPEQPKLLQILLTLYCPPAPLYKNVGCRLNLNFAAQQHAKEITTN